MVHGRRRATTARSARRARSRRSRRRRARSFSSPRALLTPSFREARRRRRAGSRTEAARASSTAQDEQGRYALYRLKKGEALYSAVVVRFTGPRPRRGRQRQGRGDRRAQRHRRRARHPVGFPVKIPVADLAPEFRPPDDPERIEEEKPASRPRSSPTGFAARDLSGVTLVLDAGHGGRDTGAIVDGLEEARYVYDIACRVERLVRARTRARVVPTVGRDAPCAGGPGRGRRRFAERPRPDDAALRDRGRRRRRQLPLVPRQLDLQERAQERRARGPDGLPVAARRLAAPGGARARWSTSRARSS